MYWGKLRCFKWGHLGQWDYLGHWGHWCQWVHLCHGGIVNMFLKKYAFTLPFDLGVSPRGLKINSVFTLDLSDLHVKFEVNKSKFSRVIARTTGRPTGHTK